MDKIEEIADKHAELFDDVLGPDLRECIKAALTEFAAGGESVADVKALRDAAEMLWVVIANVSGGDWSKQTQEWQDAAARWRDNYFVAISNPEMPTDAACAEPTNAATQDDWQRGGDLESIATMKAKAVAAPPSDAELPKVDTFSAYEVTREFGGNTSVVVQDEYDALRTAAEQRIAALSAEVDTWNEATIKCINTSYKWQERATAAESHASSLEAELANWKSPDKWKDAGLQHLAGASENVFDAVNKPPQEFKP